MSTAEPTPDWGALYKAHRDAMHKAAKRMLRGAGLVDLSGDAVQDAIESLIKSPPQEAVENWQSLMVVAAKRKALDRLKSAAVRHAGPELSDVHHHSTEPDISDDVSEDIDRQREAARARDALKTLTERDREVVVRRAVLEHPRDQVAADLGVSPARISQITKAALEQLRETMEKGAR